MNPLAWLSLLGPRVSWAIGIALAASAIYAGHLVDVHRHEVKARAAGQAEVQAVFDRYRADATGAALKAAAASRAEEQRRTAAQLEITNEAQRIAVRDRAAHAALDATAPGLRRDVAAAIARRGGSSCSPTLAAVGAPATDPADLLSLVLGEAEDRLRELAIEADRRGAAGAACAASYDALTAIP